MHPYAKITTMIRYEIEEFTGQATGFFYRAHNDNCYLVTNRHVVRHETGASPDQLRIIVREQDELIRTRPEYIDLFDEDDNPRWLTHPEFPEADIVAIPIEFEISETGNEPISENFVVGVDPEIELTGGRCLSIGYPLRIQDQNTSAPIARDTLISTIFGQPHSGEPLFLTDAQIHQGMSGSPVVTAPGVNYLNYEGRSVTPQAESGGAAMILLGVISASHEIEGINTNLNLTWYAALLDDIVRQNEGAHPWSK